MTRIVALVGVAGGVGTTRLAVECGATLARAGRDVAVFEVAFHTQGLRAYVDEQLTADVTALATEQASLGEVLYDVPVDLPGRLALAPASGPFERLARAQTAGAARQLEREFAAASLSHDVVLVDTPPVDGNQALAAVNAADRIALVTTDSQRGRDGLALMYDRLADVGAEADLALRNRDTGTISSGVGLPESDVTAAMDAPVCAEPDATFAPAVAGAVERLLDEELALEFPDGGLFS